MMMSELVRTVRFPAGVGDGTYTVTFDISGVDISGVNSSG
jgi:hypothetical protein